VGKWQQKHFGYCKQLMMKMLSQTYFEWFKRYEEGRIQIEDSQLPKTNKMLSMSMISSVPFIDSPLEKLQMKYEYCTTLARTSLPLKQRSETKQNANLRGAVGKGRNGHRLF
jgi:hypothetical protein